LWGVVCYYQWTTIIDLSIRNQSPYSAKCRCLSEMPRVIKFRMKRALHTWSYDLEMDVDVDVDLEMEMGVNAATFQLSLALSTCDSCV